MNSPYECGRLARERGCYRILCVATDEERAEWLRGYDDRDQQLKQGEQVSSRQAVQR